MLLEHERKCGLGMDALVMALALTREPALFNKAPGLKVLRAKLGHGQLHCPAAGRAFA